MGNGYWVSHGFVVPVYYVNYFFFLKKTVYFGFFFFFLVKWKAVTCNLKFICCYRHFNDQRIHDDSAEELTTHKISWNEISGLWCAWLWPLKAVSCSSSIRGLFLLLLPYFSSFFFTLLDAVKKRGKVCSRKY